MYGCQYGEDSCASRMFVSANSHECSYQQIVDMNIRGAHVSDHYSHVHIFTHIHMNTNSTFVDMKIRDTNMSDTYSHVFNANVLFTYSIHMKIRDTNVSDTYSHVHIFNTNELFTFVSANRFTGTMYVRICKIVIKGV